MDEIKKFINQHSITVPKRLSRRISLAILKSEDYDIFLKKLMYLMSQCKYREALRIIESKKNFYYNFNDSWKYQILESNCILKIIRKKLYKYQKEISNNNQHQNYSLLFWFNQVFFILEKLTLNLRTDLDKTINLNEEININRIEYVVQVHLSLIYYLCLYSKLIGQIPQLCSYFAITERIMNYIYFIRQAKTLNILQKILLLRANLLIENLDFENSLIYQKLSIDICFREFFLLLDFDSGLNSDYLGKNKKNKKYIYDNIINMVLCFYLRGVCFEFFGNISKSIEAYKQSRWICDKFLNKNQPEFTYFMKNVEKNAFIYFYIMEDIKKEIKIIQKEKIEKEKEKIKKNELEEKQKEEILKKISNGQSINNYNNLENIISNIGTINLREIESDKFNLGKSKKSKFILSTMSMLNNLLSTKFSDILQNMDKIEISKMDKTIEKKIHKRLEQLEYNKSFFIKNKFSLKNKNSKIKSKSLMKLKSLQLTKKGFVYIKSSNNNSLSNNCYHSINNSNSKNSNKKILKKETNFNSFILNSILSKKLLARKKFLEKFSKKEIEFHKQNLNAKRFEIDPDIEEFNKQKVNSDAEQSFCLKLILAQYQNHQKRKIKSMLKENLLNRDNSKRNYKIITVDSKNFNNDKDKKKSLSSINNLNYNFDNEKINLSNFDIIKQLNKETFDISKIIEEKNKLYKSYSSKLIKPKDKKFIHFIQKFNNKS